MLEAGILRRPPVSPLQFLILLQLNKGSNYGYEVLKTLREPFKGVWEPKTGTIYPALRRLEARGFVKTERVDEKDFYSLTEKGEAMLNQTGERIESNLVFADKYFRFVSERMPRTMKNTIIEKLKAPPNKAAWPLLFVECLLDDIDTQTRLEVLEIMRIRLTNVLEAVDRMISGIEDGDTS